MRKSMLSSQPAPQPDSSRNAIEVLEARIAPASLTFIDVDGDIVTIKSSKGDLSGKATFSDVGEGKQLTQLDLTDASFQGAAISITSVASKGKLGDGYVNVGYIQASGCDLGVVIVDGDLGRIDAGDADSKTPALQRLSVHSLGRMGTATQPLGVSNLSSNFFGKLGALNVITDMVGAGIDVTGETGVDARGNDVNYGQIGTVTIGGSLLGGSDASSGHIISSGDIAKVTIGRDLAGAAGSNSAVVSAGGNLLGISIGGSLRGGSGESSGKINAAGKMGPVSITWDLVGGDGLGSGIISANDLITSLTISGSLLGGSGNDSAYVNGDGIGAIKIGHDLIGGEGNRSAYINGGRERVESITVGGSWIGGIGGQSAFIYTSGGLGSTTINGNLVGGSGSGSGQIDVEGLDRILIRGSMLGGSGNYSGYIYSDGNIGPVSIMGDIRGGAGSYSGSIQGAQQYITSIKIGGSLVGGSGGSSGSIDAGGQRIGAVSIGGDIVGGNVSGSESLFGQGSIHAGHMDSLLVGGSIIAGTDTSTGSLRFSGAVAVDDEVGSVVIKGSLVGNETNPVTFIAGGGGLNNGADLAIGSFTVGGRVDHSIILAGYSFNYSNIGTPVDGNAQIGKVSVGSWIASTIAAGISAGTDQLFGTSDDVIINNVGGSVARIASITIAGTLSGSAAPGDHFGFVAPKIGGFKVSGVTVPLNPTVPPVDVIELSPATNDTTLRTVLNNG